jgi:hypothetical protein
MCNKGSYQFDNKFRLRSCLFCVIDARIDPQVLGSIGGLNYIVKELDRLMSQFGLSQEMGGSDNLVVAKVGRSLRVAEVFGNQGSCKGSNHCVCGILPGVGRLGFASSGQGMKVLG